MSGGEDAAAVEVRGALIPINGDKVLAARKRAGLSRINFVRAAAQRGFNLGPTALQMIERGATKSVMPETLAAIVAVTGEPAEKFTRSER